MLFGTDPSSLRAGWTYRSETKDKVPSIPKILALEQQRKFSPAGLCASHLSLSLALSLEPVDVAELQPDSASRSARTDPQRDSTPMCMAFGVPYSEHSSFFECALSLSHSFERLVAAADVAASLTQAHLLRPLARLHAHHPDRQRAHGRVSHQDEELDRPVGGREEAPRRREDAAHRAVPRLDVLVKEGCSLAVLPSLHCTFAFSSSSRFLGQRARVRGTGRGGMQCGYERARRRRGKPR